MTSPLGKISDKIIRHKDDLLSLGVNRLAVFGSFARNEMTSNSDIDILVDFDPKQGLFVFVELKDYLESLLQRPVDLVSTRALHPALRDQILDEARDVF